VATRQHCHPLVLQNFAAMRPKVCTLALAVVVVQWLSGCTTQRSPSLGTSDMGPKAAPDSASTTRTYDIPRFAVNSPFETEYESPIPEKGKKLWARSLLWEKAPDLVVEKWLTDEPETAGKYLLIEFWATWCRQCRLAIPRLNSLHSKFGEDMVVIGISDEKEDVVRRFKEPEIDYYIASDTQARMKDKVGVFGIPHVIIVEPGGYVVWEGFPLLKGYELTGEVVEKILKASKNGRAAEN